jgi:hypothetical protein
MGWVKARHLTDRMFTELICPYFGCPSNREGRPPKMKFIEEVQPNVSKYKCKWCGFDVLVDMTNVAKTPMERQPFIKNPLLLWGRR